MISETDFILQAKETTPFEDIKIEEVMVKKPFFVHQILMLEKL